MLAYFTGTECKKQFDLLTAEKKPEVKVEVKAKEEPKEAVVPPVAPPPAAPPPSVIKRENSSNSLDTAAEDNYFNANGHVGVQSHRPQLNTDTVPAGNRLSGIRQVPRG